MVFKSKRSAVFLDRDGTIIYDVGYPNDPEQVCLLPGVEEAMTVLQDRGFLLIIISNQSGIGRGYITVDQAEKVHNEVVSSLAGRGVSIDASYYCPHAPEDRCQCRKPLPTLLFRAAKEFDIDLANSFMVGDKQIDMEAGKNAGCHAVHLGIASISDTDDPLADYVAKDWREISTYILKRVGAG
jgi:D,D-heptose 1,7-bisphosphate phosphatase